MHCKMLVTVANAMFYARCAVITNSGRRRYEKGKTCLPMAKITTTKFPGNEENKIDRRRRSVRKKKDNITPSSINTMRRFLGLSVCLDGCVCAVQLQTNNDGPRADRMPLCIGDIVVCVRQNSSHHEEMYRKSLLFFPGYHLGPVAMVGRGPTTPTVVCTWTVSSNAPLESYNSCVFAS